MIFTPTPLKGSYIVQLTPIKDKRGWFSRTYCKDEFEQIGHTAEWVQMNHSYTADKGTIRGMHYQPPPFSEIKLIRCIRGKVFDVIIDIRKDSPTFLQWYGVELSEASMNMIYVPEGFAHGFQTLSDNCELIYHHSAVYVSGVEKGINYSDPRINITWPVGPTQISDRDRDHQMLLDNFNGI